MEATPATAYDRMNSVATLDKTLFAESDLKTVRENRSQTFLQNNASEEIFAAIASKSGNTNDKALKANVSALVKNISTGYFENIIYL